MSKVKYLLCALLLSFSLAHVAAAQESIYTVNISVDVTDVNAAQAREKAMQSAYRQAFETVVRKLTTSQDAAALNKLTNEQIVNFVKEVSVVSEKSSDVRYIAELKVAISEPLLKAYLQEKEIQTAVPDKSKVVVIPLFREFESDQPKLWENDNPWMLAWQKAPVNDALIDIEAIAATPVSQAEISAEQAQVYDNAALQEVALNNNANDVYVADAVFDGIEGLKITLTSLKADNAENVIRIAGDRKMQDVLLNEGVVQVKHFIENKIKNANIAQSQMQSSISVIYDYAKLADWIKVEQLLKSIPYVRNLQVDAMGNGKVQFRLDFVGEDTRVWNALRNKGINLKQFDNFYLLEY